MANPRTDILRRVFLVYFGIFLFAVAIIAKVIHIQIVDGKNLINKAEKQSLKYFSVEAVRGNICAADGSLMATSVPIFEVRMDVASPLITNAIFNNNINELALELSKLFKDKSKAQYKKNLIRERKKGNRYYLVKRKVSYDQLKKLKRLPIFSLGKYKGGLIVIQNTRRVKPYNLLGERTIGYANPDENLFVGLEGAFADYLKGRNGKQLKKKINNGDWKPVFDENEIEPEDGKDIITTIDIDIQDVAESALYDHLVEHKAEWGCAVLMEVETGKIKAIANLKHDPKSNKYYESYNYAVGASVEPGSTFKLASMLALFEDERINLEDTIDIGKAAYAMYSGLTIRDVHGIRDGRISVKEAFEKSSNVGISQMVYNAYSAQPQKFIDHLYDFCLNEPLSIVIPGEGNPYVKNTKDKSWSKVSLPFMSIGYEVQLTPLQILTFYNAVANNGKMVKPMFVTEVRQAGNTIEEFETEVISKQICSEESIQLAQEILEGVVEKGTATALNKSAYKVGGKTGTAQIANKKKGYDKSNYNASFVGYFPAEDPKYSCIVVVNRPSTGKYYATSVAVPVFHEIADKVYATSLEIQNQIDTLPESTVYPVYAAGYEDELEEIYNTLNIPLDSLSTNAEWAIALQADSAIQLKPRIIKENLVPNVVGMGVKDAIYILENMGLKVSVDGKGYVKKQSQNPGVRVKKGSHIALKLSA